MQLVDRWVPAAGWFCATVLAAFFGSSLLMVALSIAPPRNQALGLAVLAGLWLSVPWLINRLFLTSWLWLWLRLIGGRDSKRL